MDTPYPVDLQVHSTFSDGTDTPAELVAKAAQRGICVLALTDHDSVLGIDEAITAGTRHGVTIVPALEFSTTADRRRDLLDINILAYGIDHHHPELLSVLERVIESRVEQKVRQVERLQGYGIDVPIDEVLAEASGIPGRVHIARVALRRNPRRFTDIDDVFRQFLATDAKASTYVRRRFSLSVFDTIALTHMAGGLAVLAHPGSYVRIRDIDGVVERLAQTGLDGLEVSYTYGQNRGHKGASSREIGKLVHHFDALADACGLFKTGGSDYHGETKPDIEIGQAGLTEAGWAEVQAEMKIEESSMMNDCLSSTNLD